VVKCERVHTCSYPLRWAFVKVLDDERDDDSQTWFATDISMENPINPPFAGGDMFWKPPLLGNCIETWMGMAGLGTAGGVRTILSYAAPLKLGTAAVLVCAAVRGRKVPP